MRKNSSFGRSWQSRSYRCGGLLAAVLLTACRDELNEAPAPTSGTLKLRMEYVARDPAEPFSVDSAYLTASDDLVRIQRLRYYVSRVRLQRADSSYWTAPGRAYLLDAGHRDTIVLDGVPLGEYVRVAFDIGLDSVTNSRTDWGGDLAPVHEMFWSWDTGYKFVDLTAEWLGSAPPSGIEYHIGRALALRTVRLPLPRAARVVAAGAAPTVRLAVRPLTVFGGPSTMWLNDSHDRNVMFDTPQALRVADNYASMFSVAGIE